MSYKNTSEYVLVDNVAADLIDRNGTTTTKEIKEELRKLYPGAWYQATVSDIMKELSDEDGKYSYDDLGDYREYRTLDPVPTPVPMFATIDDLIDDEDDDDGVNAAIVQAFDDTDDIPTTPAPAPVSTTPVRGNILNRMRMAFSKK